MPWNPFKSKKDKKDKSAPIRAGFHPIDLDALENESSGGGLPPTSVVSPAKSDDAASLSSLDDAPLPAFPQYGRDGLLSAAFTGTTEVLKLMLALGPEAKLHKCDSLGNTPLHLAAFSGHHDAVVELLQTASVWHNMSDRATQAVQVDVMVRNGEDDTPLYMAVLCNNLDIVRLLADACDRQVNLRNVEGFSPLHYAAGEGNLEITRFLVEECNGDCAAKDKLGLTPAFCAVLQGRLEVAEYLLLQHPATVADVNSSLDTMLHCAIKGLETDPETMAKMVTLLISLEAPLDIPGAPPQKMTARQLLKASKYSAGFQHSLHAKPSTDTDQDESNGAYRPSAAAEKECTNEAAETGAEDGGKEGKEQDVVRELRQEATKARFFNAYLCAVSDICEAPETQGGIPAPPLLPAEFLEGPA